MDFSRTPISRDENNGGDNLSSWDSPSQQRNPNPRRACEECSRKKTKCDMNRPTCSLCVRTGRDCVFPTRRRSAAPRAARRESRIEIKEKKIDRLLELLGSQKSILLSNQERQGNATYSPPTQTVPESVLMSPGEQPAPSSSSTLNASTGSEGPIGLSYSELVDFESWPSIASGDSQNIPNLWFPEDQSQLFGETQADRTTLRTRRAQVGIQDEEHATGVNPSFTDVTTRESSQLETLDEEFSSPLIMEGSEFIPIPAAVAEDLVELFFEHVQCFLPLFHRPSFYARYTSNYKNREERFSNLSLENAFVLNGMFALSARFSSSEYLSNLSPRDCGESFAKRAEHLYDQGCKLERRESLLQFLQGCLLLASYRLTSGISSPAWLITGVCCRLAYDLRLHTLDHDVIHGSGWESAKEWVQREEKRRAWWSAWELDGFASTVTCRPYGFDRHRIQVLLPVSDEAWFSNTPVASAVLRTDSLTAWKTLEGCPNQDERAWFLVSGYLLRVVQDMLQAPGGPSPQIHQDIEAAILCFALVLPPKFGFSSGKFLIENQNWRSSSWVVCTHLVLQGAAIYAALWKPGKTLQSPRDLLDSASLGKPHYQRCRRNTVDMLLIIRNWAPERMPFSPFIACTLLGPWAVHIENCLLPKSEYYGESTATELDIDILKLCLKRHAWYWDIGALLLDLVNLRSDLNSRRPPVLTPKERQLVERFPIVSPSSLQCEMII